MKKEKKSAKSFLIPFRPCLKRLGRITVCYSRYLRGSLVSPADLVMWMKKRGRRGRHFRREELLAFLSGKAPPPPSARPMTTVASGMSSSSGGSLVGPSTTHHHPHHHPHHPHHRKTNASILSTYCNADAGTNHHHPHHHHHRRSLSASPSLTDSNVWVPTDFSTTGYQDGAKNNCDGVAAVNNNNSNNNNNHSHHPGLFLEPDLRTFRDALAVGFHSLRLLKSRS